MRLGLAASVSCLLLAGPGDPLWAAAAHTAAARTAPSTTVVRPGEDCHSLVRRVYGDDVDPALALQRFHDENPGLGALPHRLLPGAEVRTPPLRAHAPAGADVPRLSYVGPAVRTQMPRDGWTEALPDQPVQRRMRIQTSPVGGAEIRLQPRARLQLDPNATLLVNTLSRRGPSEVQLQDGAIRSAQEPSAARVTVRTPSADFKLRGGARIEALGAERATLAVYDGSAAVRGRGREISLRAGQGTLVQAGARPLPPRPLPAAPAWAAPLDHDRLLLSVAGLREAPAAARVRLDFQRVAGAEQYLIEIARDDRFNERRAGGEVVTPPFQIDLSPGVYYARVSAIDHDRLVGPPSPVRRVRVVALRTDAAPASPPPAAGPGAPALPLARARRATLLLSGGGLPLSLQVDGAAPIDCAGEAQVELGPQKAPHRLAISSDEDRADVLLSVTLPPPPPPPAPAAAPPVEPLVLPPPLSAPGFPARAVQPRTRAYALFGVGAEGAGARPEVYRLDLGGELALWSRRFSFDVNLPLLYQDLSTLDSLGRRQGGAALGDPALGLRALALSAVGGRLSLGLLLRVQVPVGTFARAQDPGGHPLAIDPALGLAARLGRLGLLTTQGATAVVNVAQVRASWSMTYAAQVDLLRHLSALLEVSASLGLVGGAPTGASLGGGLRVPLSGGARLLLGGGAGLGRGGQAAFGGYHGHVGAEWAR